MQSVEVVVPESLVSDGVHDHLEKEGRLEDDVHRTEVTDEMTLSFKHDFLMDAIVKAEQVQVSESELSEYIVRTASRYGMAPRDFANEIAKAGQIGSIFADVARAKALAVVLERIDVKDASGKKVDLTELRPKSAIQDPEPNE
jgi:trigger factor